MKRFAFAVLGLFLAALAITTAHGAMQQHGDPILLLVAAGLAYGAFVALRRVARLASPKAPAAPAVRPWEH